MPYALCRHIRTNGLQCKSPALSEKDYCFYHDRLYRRHSPFRYTEAARGYLLPGRDLELTALEDRESVQLALSLVINALATGQLETKRATALLYGLQTASNNAARLRPAAFDLDIVRTTEITPEGLDLALPGVTYDPPTITLEEDDEEEEEPQQQVESEHGKELRHLCPDADPPSLDPGAGRHHQHPQQPGTPEIYD